MKNKEIRDSFKKKNCLVCDRFGCDPCHIKTYATTRNDDPENLLPFCRFHHIEQGQISWKKFCDKYPNVYLVLKKRGFDFNSWDKLIKI